jgi:outer membrane autotransporter protein
MGTITGSGGLTKVGSGTLTLYDFSTYTGATTVAGGLLEVNGGIQSSFVTVNGGKLGGIGTVGGVLVNSGGTVSPGATTPLLLLLSFLPAPVTTVGTLNVSGNVTFLKGSVFEVEIEPGGSSDLLQVGGNVTLSGGNVAVSQASGFYATGTRYTIIDAEGDVAGKFDGFARTMPFMNLELVYDPHHVYLDVTRNSVAFCDVAITANQCSSSRGADSLGEGNPLFNIILGLPDVASARAAFDALSGELHASARSALIEDSHFLRDSIFDRIRHASLGAGASPQFAALAQVSDFDAQQRTQEGTGLTAWTQAYGAFGHISGNGNAARLDRSSGGFFIGADTTLGETWTIGLATGYSRTSLEVDGRSSRATVDSYHLALYGGARFGNVGLRLGASQTWHHIESSRSITFPGLADSARADYDARSTQLFGEAGYAMDFGPVAIEPFAGLAWVYLDSDRIRENGGVAALNGRGESDSNLFTTLGMRAASEVWKGEGKSLTVRGTLGWRHAFGDVAQSTAFSFAGGSGFNVSGIPIARNALLVEAGFDVKVGQSFTIGAGYSGQFASGNRDHNFRGTLSYRF